MKEIKTFQSAANKYLEKVSVLIKEQSESMSIDSAKDLADLILRVAQSIKTMSDKDVKKKELEDNGVSMVDRWANQKNGQQ